MTGQKPKITARAVAAALECLETSEIERYHTLPPEQLKAQKLRIVREALICAALADLPEQAR